MKHFIFLFLFTLSSFLGFAQGDVRVAMEIVPVGHNDEFGFYLRADKNACNGYKTSFSATNQMVSLRNTDIKGVHGLKKPIMLDLIMKGEVIDMCVDGRRCIVSRTPAQKRSTLCFFAKHGTVAFKFYKNQSINSRNKIRLCC